jgi:hypothetical protein
MRKSNDPYRGHRFPPEAIHHVLTVRADIQNDMQFISALHESPLRKFQTPSIKRLRGLFPFLSVLKDKQQHELL